MLPCMIAVSDKLKIGEPVIRAVAVLVMNIEPFRDRAAIVLPARPVQIGDTLCPSSLRDSKAPANIADTYGPET